MTLRIRPDRHLPGAYSYLCQTEPFFGMRPKLLDADDIKFLVTRDRDTAGYFLPPEKAGGYPTIAISSTCVGSTLVLHEIMGHEMIHLHQWMSKTDTPNTMHNAAFHKWAEKVCRAHVFDIKSFAGEAK
jgi:hypothetical protein